MEIMEKSHEDDVQKSTFELGGKICGESEENVEDRVMKDVKERESNSVHDPNLFTGVTAPVKPNLFTGVTAPVPQVSHNETNDKDLSKKTDEEVCTKMRKENHPHNSQGKQSKSPLSVLEKVLKACTKHNEDTIEDRTTKAQKSPFKDDVVAMDVVPHKDERNERNNENEKQEQNEDTEGKKIDSKKIHAVPYDILNNADVAKEDMKKQTKTMKVNQNDSSLPDESLKGGNNATSAMDVSSDKTGERNIEESHKKVACEKSEKLTKEEHKVDDAIKQINRIKNSESNDEKPNGNGLVVQEHDTASSVMKTDASKIICVKKEIEVDVEEDTKMSDQHQTAETETMKIDSSLKVITNTNSNAASIDEKILEGEKQNADVETVNNYIEALVKGSNATSVHEKSKGVLANGFSYKMENFSDSDITAGKEKNDNWNAVKVPTAIQVEKLDSSAHNIEGVQRKKRDWQSVNENIEGSGMEQSKTVLTERNNVPEISEAGEIKQSERMYEQEPNIDAKILSEMREKPQVKKESIEPVMLLPKGIDEKYPADTDMLPPSDIPVENPTPNDILFGRGGLTNHHPGNRRFRDIVVLHKDDYMKAVKIVKPRVARKIVKAIRTGNPPGRFLKKNAEDNKWYDVGDRNAAEKASQALREKSQNEKKETKAKAKARYKKNEDSMKSLGNIISYGNIPVSSGPTMYGKGGTMMSPFPFVTPAMYGIIPPPGVQIPLLPAMPPLAQYRGDSLNPSKGTYSKSNGTSSRTTADKKDDDEKDNYSPTKSKTPASDGATNENLSNVGTGQSNDEKLLTYPTTGGIFGTTYPDGDIMVTDQDILCGRGGATNHHKGNKRFRDIVAVHRPDYVRAPKVQKPGVARLIVKAIRSGNPAGRFLKKGSDGKWYDIGDKRAAEKASQALREKPPDERKSRAQANNDYFTFLAQNSAYGMHAGAIQGHTYVYPAYPATIVPQQHINPALQGMQPLYMNLSTSKSTAASNISNGDKTGNQISEQNVGEVGECMSNENNTSVSSACSPRSPKRQKIEPFPGAEVAASSSTMEIPQNFKGTEV